MSDRNCFPLDQNGGKSTPNEIPYQIKPEEHCSIIAAITRCDGSAKSTLPNVVVCETPTTSSLVDELRKHAANHDRIRPFEPLPARSGPTLGNWGAPTDEHWKSFKETIERGKRSSLIDAVLAAMHLKPGHHYALNPNSGKIVLQEDHLTLDYRPEIDGYNDGRPQYQVDPRTGLIVQKRQICTLELREYRDGGREDDHCYGLNPDTGRIELKPNVRTMDFRSK